jgi:poly-gamma-glutamate capsule biosynthesis protein CapA/YwtB (metallophosphatase superfamily)
MHLVLVGDVMLGRLVNDALKEKPPAYPWGDTLSLLQEADFRACNLECALADHDVPWAATPKAFHFRSDAKNIAVLRAAGMTAVSLANNHTLDFGEEALFEMLQTLDAAGISHAGAGRTLAEAARPAIIEFAGHTIGWLAWTDNEPDWEAGAARSGIFYVPARREHQQARHLLALIGQLKEQGIDWIIVSAHWGPNWGAAPPADQQPFARALIDAGADLVFGHSGHVVRGIEVYRERPILYCVGDFIDDYAVDPLARNDQSYLVSLEVEGRAVRRLRLYPTIIQDMHACLATGREAEEIAARVQRRCADLGTDTIWRSAAGYLECRRCFHTAGFRRGTGLATSPV